MARDVFDTFATHAGLGHEVTDTDCWAGKWRHSRSCFRDFQTSIFDKHVQKSSGKVLCV